MGKPKSTSQTTYRIVFENGNERFYPNVRGFLAALTRFRRMKPEDLAAEHASAPKSVVIEVWNLIEERPMSLEDFDRMRSSQDKTARAAKLKEKIDRLTKELEKLEGRCARTPAAPSHNEEE